MKNKPKSIQFTIPHLLSQHAPSSTPASHENAPLDVTSPSFNHSVSHEDPTSKVVSQLSDSGTEDEFHHSFTPTQCEDQPLFRKALPPASMVTDTKSLGGGAVSCIDWSRHARCKRKLEKRMIMMWAASTVSLAGLIIAMPYVAG